MSWRITSILTDALFQRFNDFLAFGRTQSVEIGRIEGGSGGVVRDSKKIFIRPFARAQKRAEILLPQYPDEAGGLFRCGARTVPAIQAAEEFVQAFLVEVGGTGDLEMIPEEVAVLRIGDAKALTLDVDRRKQAAAGRFLRTGWTSRTRHRTPQTGST